MLVLEDLEEVLHHLCSMPTQGVVCMWILINNGGCTGLAFNKRWLFKALFRCLIGPKCRQDIILTIF